MWSEKLLAVEMVENNCHTTSKIDHLVFAILNCNNRKTILISDRIKVAKDIRSLVINVCDGSTPSRSFLITLAVTAAAVIHQNRSL